MNYITMTCLPSKSVRLRFVIGLILGVIPVIHAETIDVKPHYPGDFVPERLGVQQEFTEEALEPTQKKPGFTLPPLPSPSPSEQRLSSQPTVFVETIELTGNTVFSDEALKPILRQYEGKLLFLNELQDLRKALTMYYVNSGYVNSGALILDQALEAHVLKVQIIEGHLSEIKIEGDPWLQDRYIQNRLGSSRRDVLNIHTLQQRLLLLQQDRLIERVDAELVPGQQRGEGVLKLKVEETRPYEFGIVFNNQRSTSIGELRGEVYAAAHNLTGYGDSLTLRYGLTEGLDDGSASYAVPLNAQDTRLSLYYSRSDTTVVERGFDDLHIDSETESFGATLSHPLYRTVRSQFTVSLSLDRRQSRSVIAGEKFPGNGESDVTAIRLAQNWVTRSPEQVIALRSSLNFGWDRFGTPDTKGHELKGHFFSWLGQAQYIQRLWGTDNQMIVRGNVQLSPERLVSMEKFAVGGLNSVRGYRENLLVRDQGATATLEFRLPLFRLPLPYISVSQQDGQVQLAPFVDFGWSDNNDQASDFSANFTTVASAGIGLRWNPHQKIHSQLYWGYAFRDIDDFGEGGLQDSGLHFLLNIQLF